MSDRYLNLINSPMGKSIANSVGLPQPELLKRHQAGDDFMMGTCVLGASKGAKLGGVLVAILKTGQSKILVNDSEATAALNSGFDVYQEGEKISSLVFDATGIKNSEQLVEMFNFFQPVVRSMASCGRIIVLGRTPETLTDPKYRTAQRALEGFIKCTGKEIKKGTSSQLIYVEEGAEERLSTTLRFFLSAKSAFVSGQVVRISQSKTADSEIELAKPLAGKVALVTGAARGIGAAIAEVLARDGAHVVCLDIPPAEEDLKKVSSAINGSYLAMDVTAEDTPKVLADHFEKEHKGLDILVHNAGVTRDKTLGKMPEHLWHMVLDINLSSEERINDEMLSRKTINPGGHVICISSISGIAGNFGQSNYGTSKAGVIGMVQAMAPILVKDEITINAVAPGFIETQMTAEIPFATREVGRRLSSLSQGGLPVDVAETIAWYANPNSQGVTGNIVRVCGQSFLGA